MITFEELLRDLSDDTLGDMCLEMSTYSGTGILPRGYVRDLRKIYMDKNEITQEYWDGDCRNTIQFIYEEVARRWAGLRTPK